MSQPAISPMSSHRALQQHRHRFDGNGLVIAGDEESIFACQVTRVSDEYCDGIGLASCLVHQPDNSVHVCVCVLISSPAFKGLFCAGSGFSFMAFPVAEEVLAAGFFRVVATVITPEKL